MTLHIFIEGTADQANTLYTQLKKRVTMPLVLHCISNTTEHFTKYIDIIHPSRIQEYAWIESMYLEIAGLNNFILYMPASVFVAARFETITDIPTNTIRFDNIRGFGFWNTFEITEKDYIDFGSFEEFLQAKKVEFRPMDEGFYSMMPIWYDRSKEVEAFLYDTDLGLYNPILPDKAHIELTDECAVKCPMCIQTSHSDPTKPSIFVRRKQHTLGSIQAIFTPEFIKESKLKHIELCGNVGEPTQARDFLEICRYFVGFGIVLSVHTNGMKVKEGWWTDLARVLNTTWSSVIFGLDGATAETHQAVRPGTDFKQILSNAEEFIRADGVALWKFVVFNQPRAERFAAEKLSETMGFKQFICIGNYPVEQPPLPKEIARKIAEPVNDAKPTPRTEVKKETKALASPVIRLENIQTRRSSNAYIERRISTGSSIRCRAKVENRFYIDAGGNVFPCLWTGMEILKAAMSPHHETPFPYNWDLNNAKKYPLKDILTNEFFTRYMSYSLKLDPSQFCRRQCGV